jgi:hypothetical protein
MGRFAPAVVWLQRMRFMRGLSEAVGARGVEMMNRQKSNDLLSLVQNFFGNYLERVRGVSDHLKT